MRSVRGPVVICFVAAFAVGAFAEAEELNPTVSVLPRSQTLVPTDCDVGLAPAAPRPPVAVATTQEEAPLSPTMPTVTVTTLAPPSGDLRTHLRRIQSAAESEYYDGFKTALSDARLALSGYPRGGEREAAEDVLRVDSDLERLWDYAYNSPTGAFFDETSQNGALIAMMRRYSAFPRAVAGSTLIVDDHTLYPSRETRLLLVDEAAKRLARLGVRTPSRVIIERPPIRSQKPITITSPRSSRTQRPTSIGTSRPTHRKTTTTVTRRPATRKTQLSTSRKTTRKPTQIAQVQPHTTKRRTTEPIVTPPPHVTPVPAPVTPVPQPQPAPVPQPQPTTTQATTTESIPPNVTTQPPPTATTAATETTTTAAPETTSTVSTATTSTTSTSEKPAPVRGGMNLTFAIILIVIGIGVLIVLFRASD